MMMLKMLKLLKIFFEIKKTKIISTYISVPKHAIWVVTESIRNVSTAEKIKNLETFDVLKIAILTREDKISKLF